MTEGYLHETGERHTGQCAVSGITKLPTQVSYESKLPQQPANPKSPHAVCTSQEFQPRSSHRCFQPPVRRLQRGCIPLLKEMLADQIAVFQGCRIAAALIDPRFAVHLIADELKVLDSCKITPVCCPYTGADDEGAGHLVRRAGQRLTFNLRTKPVFSHGACADRSVPGRGSPANGPRGRDGDQGFGRNERGGHVCSSPCT